MFGISGEHILVLAVVLLIFGPKRLPDLGSSLGKTLRNFKEAMNNVGNEEPQRNANIQHTPAPQVQAQAPVAEEATIVSPEVAAQAQPAEVKNNATV